MAKVPSLKSISKLASCHVLLDFVEDTHPRLTKHLITQLQDGIYSAVTEELLQCLLQFYSEKLTNELLKAVVPCHLRELKIDKCLPQLTFFGLTELMKKCHHLQKISLKECDQLMSPGQFVLWRRMGCTITALSLESCHNVTDQVIQSALRHINTLQHLNISSCDNLTEKVFLLNEDLQKEREFTPTHQTDHHYECSLISIDVSGCPGITATAVRHLTSLTGPTLKNVNLSWTSINLIAILSLAGYSLPAMIELVISYYNKSDALQDPKSDDLYKCLLEFKQTLEKVEQQQQRETTIEECKIVKEQKIESKTLTHSKIKSVQALDIGGNVSSNGNIREDDLTGTANNNEEKNDLICSADIQTAEISLLTDSTCSASNSLLKYNVNTCTEDVTLSECSSYPQLPELNNGTESSSGLTNKAECVHLENVEIDFIAPSEVSIIPHDESLALMPETESEDFICKECTIDSDNAIDNGALCSYQNDSNHVSSSCSIDDVVTDSSSKIENNTISNDMKLNDESEPFVLCSGLSYNTDIPCLDDSTVQTFVDKGLSKSDSSFFMENNHFSNLSDTLSSNNSQIDLQAASNIDLSDVPQQNNTKSETEKKPEAPVSAEGNACAIQQQNIEMENTVAMDTNDNQQNTLTENLSSVQDKMLPALMKEEFEVNKERIVQTYKPQLVSVDVTNKFSTVYETVGFDCLKEFLRCCPNLQKFGMSWAGLSDEMVRDLTPYFKDLKEISLMDCESVTYGITHIGQTCQNLEKVDFNGIHFIKDIFLRPFLQKPELQCLYLAESDISDGTLFRLAARKMDKFQELDLSWCDEVTVQGLNALCRKPSPLQKLSFRHCPATPFTLALMAENLKQLQSLNICSVDSITDASVVYLVENLPLLQEIDIGWNSGLSDVCVNALLRSCIYLKKAVLSGLKYLTSAPFLPIISDLQQFRRCQALLRFKLQERNVLQENGESQYSSDEEYEELCVPHRSTTYASSLQILELEYCDCVDDNHLAEIVAVCRGSLYIVDYFREAIKPVMIHAQKGKLYLPPR